MLCGCPRYGVDGSSGSPEKTFSINFADKMLVIICYLFVNWKEIFKFKANNKNVNFPTQFSLGRISNGFGTAEST